MRGFFLSDITWGEAPRRKPKLRRATFCTALDKDNTQSSDSTITMQETIDALKESADLVSRVGFAANIKARELGWITGQ